MPDLTHVLRPIRRGSFNVKMDAMPMRLSCMVLSRLACFKIWFSGAMRPALPVLVGVCLMLFAPAVTAQSTTSTQETFLAYRCEFEPTTNQAMIYAALTDTNGLPLPRSSY